MNRESPVPDGEEPSAPSRFTGFHARTYEMELLVSGALVFGLLQLPRVLGPVFDRLDAVLAGQLLILVGAAQSYVLMMLWVVIGTFVLHLVMRAYWIGLLGLESVFPDGVRWERVPKESGPLTVEIYRRRLGSLAAAIDRADDRCSLLFSFGFLIVSIFIYSVVVVAAAVGVSTIAGALVLGGRHVDAVFWSVIALVIAAQAAGNVLDKKLGRKLVPGSAGARVVGSLVRVSAFLGPMRWMGIVPLTLSTNLSPGRVSAAIVTVCLVLGVSHVAMVFVGQGLVHLGSLSYFPSSLREGGIDPAHYRDLRGDDIPAPGTPSVQSRVVQGPFLELVVGYSPNRHNPLVHAACPDLAPLQPDGLRFGRSRPGKPGAVRSAESCVGSLFQVRLDGGKLKDPDWDFTVDPGSRLPALMTMIPLADLTAGRHELEVDVPGRKAEPGDPRPERHVIPFWR